MNALASVLRVKAYVDAVTRHNIHGFGLHRPNVIDSMGDHALMRSDVVAMGEAMAAVLEIHQPSTETPRKGEPVYCLGCHDAAQKATLPPYPCATARAMGVPAL